MPKPRFSGGSVSIRVSSSHDAAAGQRQQPAMQLSAVDLPQPDGPSRAMNSPRLIVIVSSLSALNACAAGAGEAAGDAARAAIR